MSLKVTPSNPTLDRKLKLLGFEIPDLIFLLILLSVLNFIFQDGLKLFFVWVPTSTAAIILRLGKRGKPDKYLVHLIKYWMSPGVHSAFPSPTVNLSAPKLRRGA